MSSTLQGYLYVPDEDNSELSQACLGATIRRHKQRPPWIFVAHLIESIIVSRWPGKLWQVRIIDTEGIEQDCAGGTRAWAVEICGQIPASRLFGEHGGAVSSVIATASRLELVQVHSLAAARHPDAGLAYTRAWRNWLVNVGSSRDVSGQNLAGTLSMAAEVSFPDKRSPINSGFMVLYRTLWNRAESLAGSSAFVIDEDEKYLESTWSTASYALLEAAMAVGAPVLLDKEDRDILLTSWRSVFGSDPTEVP